MLMNCERKNMIFLGMLPVAIYCEAFQEFFSEFLGLHCSIVRKLICSRDPLQAEFEGGR